MSGITNIHLDAAIIDQNVAGEFHGKTYAFVDIAAKGRWQLGVAVQDEPGYNPINKFFKTQAEAHYWRDGLNAHIGLAYDAALDIILSTMRKPQVAVRP